MKFPIDVIKIENKVVLLQGYISPEFKRKLKDINDKMWNEEIEEFRYIDEYDDDESLRINIGYVPELVWGSSLRINGNRPSKDYKMVAYDIEPNEMDYFPVYKRLIEHYKKVMGYEDWFCNCST